MEIVTLVHLVLKNGVGQLPNEQAGRQKEKSLT